MVEMRQTPFSSNPLRANCAPAVSRRIISRVSQIRERLRILCTLLRNDRDRRAIRHMMRDEICTRRARPAPAVRKTSD